MDRDTKSINLNRSFTKLSLDEKRELRAVHEDLHNRFMAALGDLQSIQSTAGRSRTHSDPMEALRDLQDVLKFSDVPQEFKKRQQKAVSVMGVESIVKHHMQNENYRSPSQLTAASQQISPGSHVVDPARPLPLSFEARREHIMKRHTSRTESGLSGLFSKNAALVPGVAQGPIPDLYAPPPSSRRSEIEAVKNAQLSKVIARKSRPAADHQPQLHLQGRKVAKDFIPSCCVPHSPSQDPNERANVQKRAAERHSKFISPAPFK